MENEKGYFVTIERREGEIGSIRYIALDTKENPQFMGVGKTPKEAIFKLEEQLNTEN